MCTTTEVKQHAGKKVIKL